MRLMNGRPDRSFLCSRCGGITEEAVVRPDGRGEGACPDCGLGFSVAFTVTSVFTGSADAGSELSPPSPEWTAHRRKREDALRNRPFVVYGLDSRWSGTRWVGGWGTSDDEIDHLGLGHGDHLDDAAPLVVITTWRLSGKWPALTVANAAQGLAEYLWQEGAPHELVRPTFNSEDPTASWSELLVSVDGQPTVFRSLAAGPFWVALAEIGNSLITIEARNVAPDNTGLVTIDDDAPYLAGDRP
jgi:hypothetical protein